MSEFSWNPVFREIMRLKGEFAALNPDLSNAEICDQKEQKTCVDRWILATNDPFWAEIRPFLVIKQYKSAILLKYGNIAMLGDLAAPLGMETPDQVWAGWNYFLTYCRSITIDVEREMILTAPFDKFFNIDELEITSWDRVKTLMANAKNIEFSNKLDGSICIARYIPEDEDFFVTSSGSLNATEDQATVLRSIRAMFFAPENAHLREFVKDYRDFTCMFEYIATSNPIVVHYTKEDEGLYLIGLRNVHNGGMTDYKTLQTIAHIYQIKVTSIFKGTLDDIMELVKTKKSDEMEGFVINIDGHLFKLKTDDYVKIHRLISKMSAPNVIIKAVADGIIDDVVAKIPEAYRKDILQIVKIVEEYQNTNITAAMEYYDQAPKENTKDFMIWVDKNVPKKLQGAVRNKYLDREVSFLRTARGSNYSYAKMKDIDPEFYDKYKTWGNEE